MLTFERGNSTGPKGHALLYFSSEKGQLLATYMVILPVRMEVGKYLPPMFASQMGDMSGADFSAFAMPPMPEEIETYQQLEGLADMRDDDLICGGSISPDLAQGMQEVNEIVQEYARLYADYRESSVQQRESAIGVDEVVYELMGEKEKLEELSKLMVNVRSALECADETMLRETEAAILALARQLPQWYRMEELLEAIKEPSSYGAELSKLYLDRCYKLAAEDYAGVRETEEAISKLREGGGQGK
ncbi:MAG: hypothetical protein ACLFVA_06465 [Dehalococcoidia bacterium]